MIPTILILDLITKQKFRIGLETMPCGLVKDLLQKMNLDLASNI